LVAGGDTTGALLVLERAAEKPSRVETLVNLGVLYLEVGRSADAANAFRRAIASFPSRTDLMIFLGGMLLEQRHADEAVRYLEEVVRREPESGVDLALLSLAYADIGRSPEAVQLADRAVERGGQPLARKGKR